MAELLTGEIVVTFTVNGERAVRDRRAAHAALRLPPPRPRAHRHARRLRAGRLRRLHGPRRRRARPLVPPRSPSRPRAREVETVEGLATRRRAAPDPAGLPRVSRPPVRLLHAGSPADRRGTARPRIPDPSEAEIREAPRRATSAAAPATSASSMPSSGRPSCVRRRDVAAPPNPRYVGRPCSRGRGPAPPDAGAGSSSTTSSFRACSTPPSSAARTPTRRSTRVDAATARAPSTASRAVSPRADLSDVAAARDDDLRRGRRRQDRDPALLPRTSVRHVGEAVAVVVARVALHRRGRVRADRRRVRAARRRSSTPKRRSRRARRSSTTSSATTTSPHIEFEKRRRRRGVRRAPTASSRSASTTAACHAPPLEGARRLADWDAGTRAADALDVDADAAPRPRRARGAARAQGERACG